MIAISRLRANNASEPDIKSFQFFRSNDCRNICGGGRGDPVGLAKIDCLYPLDFRDWCRYAWLKQLHVHHLAAGCAPGVLSPGH